jgi:hypothetical protein
MHVRGQPASTGDVVSKYRHCITQNNVDRTLTFDLSQGVRLELADLVKPGIDPLTALPPRIRPYLRHWTGLNRLTPPARIRSRRRNLTHNQMGPVTRVNTGRLR